MATSKGQSLSVVALTLFVVLSPVVADELPGKPAPVIIQYGLDPDRDDTSDTIGNPGITLDQYGLVGGLLAGYANRSVARENFRNTTTTLEFASGVDLDRLLTEHWRCFGLPEGTDNCRKLVVNGPNGVIGDPADVDPAHNSHAIAISFYFSVEYFRGVNQHVGANARVFLLESDGEEYEIVDQFVHWYISGAPDSIDQSPFYLKPQKVSSREVKKRAAARAYWFDDGAEPLHALVEDFGMHFPDLLDTLFRAMVTPEGRLEFKSWYESLEKVSDVFDKKAINCPRDHCSYSIISLDNPDGRNWLIKPYQRVPIIRAVPSVWFRSAP